MHSRCRRGFAAPLFLLAALPLTVPALAQNVSTQGESEPAVRSDQYPPQPPESGNTPSQKSSLEANDAAKTQPTPLAPPLEVNPAVFSGNGTVTLTIPPNFPLSTNRFRVGIYEAGRPKLLADVQREFSLVNGRQQTSLTIQAPVGRYELRLVSGDKSRTPIAAAGPALLTVPGIDREPGWWLFNGSPFTRAALRPHDADWIDQNADRSTTVPALNVAPNAPLFLTGLQRNRTGQDKAASTDVPFPAPNTFFWRTMSLPPGRELFSPDFSAEKLTSTIGKLMAKARANEEIGFAGFELSLDPEAIEKVGIPGAKRALAQTRTSVQQAAPGAALLCAVDAGDGENPAMAEALSAIAPECDGIIIYPDSRNRDATLWTIKIARRIAEEQPAYDLPIFVRQQNSPTFVNSLDYFFAGVTGFIAQPAKPSRGMSQTPSFLLQGSSASLAKIIERNASLFVGSVTLEDVGLATPPALESIPESNRDKKPGADALNHSQTIALYQTLRQAGRIPLLARSGKRGSRETFVMSLGDRISQQTINDLRDAAQDGARLYLEGTPFLDETGKYAGWRLSSLVGAEAKTMGVDRSGPSTNRTRMTLEDGWMFGTARGTSLDVVQSVTVKIVNPNLVENIKPERGLYRPRGPRSAALLADGSPGIIVNAIGKGEVIWMPHRVVLPANDFSPSNLSTYIAAMSPSVSTFYEAIASYLQPGLVQVRALDRKSGGANDIRVALRRSPKGTLLLGLFNDGDKVAKIGAGVDGIAGVALDLTTEKEAPVTTSGFFSEAVVELPPHSATVLAFAQNRKALDEERNTPRLKVRLK